MTKQALLLGMMDRLEAQLLRAHSRHRREAELPPVARLQQIIQHHLSLVLERHSLPIQLLAEASAAGDPALLLRMRGIMRGYLEMLVRLGKEAAAGGSLPADVDPGVLAVWLLGGPAAMAIEHRLRVDPALERHVEDKLVPFMFQLLGRAEGGPP